MRKESKLNYWINPQDFPVLNTLNYLKCIFVFITSEGKDIYIDIYECLYIYIYICVYIYLLCGVE